ncbi:large terminase [Nocardioides marmoriginsengisoli]|uniref:Large terminase n=1 Tax=Nocardioides marmoriginsengisoli TaxID=661483 RepID=A0A3N0CTH4_9ACTN|nr:large terminase [Nocardioides marmoriginsengisoli]RNL66253.1 large terminase [Nocardioides marmoriginsengisoli]
MATLVVPKFDPDAPWPTLGPSVCDFIEERMIFGPGSIEGEPAVLDVDIRAALYSLYEIYPQGHQWAGRRRFKRGGYSCRKGLSKTEKLAWVIATELHPEAPVRCDGFDAYGQPVGRPVKRPYIPILSVTVDQVEELAYGALMYIIREGPDADLFDVSNERVQRLSPTGAEAGVAVPVSNSPSARDGARTTFQAVDEPHQLTLPRQKKAVRTMRANLPKRPLEDAWEFYVGTAGEPGENSVQEDLHAEATAIDRGEIEDPRLFYFYRHAGGTYELKDKKQRIEAISEATGPIGEYGPGQFDDIASQWDQPNADTNFLERVWLNRWTRSSEQAFDPNRRKDLLRKGRIKPGSFVTAGFDGARFRDSTAIVITDIVTGRQELWACWERPANLPDDQPWEIDEDEVTASVEQLMKTHNVWRFNGDPPHWTETLGSWAGRWPCVEEWWTIRKVPMARAIKSYNEALGSEAVTFSEDHPNEATFAQHYAAAGRRYLKIWDEDEHAAGEEPRRLWILQKLHPDRKFDAQMAAILSWEARLAALKANAKPPRRKKKAAIGRIR